MNNRIVPWTFLTRNYWPIGGIDSLHRWLMAPGEWQELAPVTEAFRSDTSARISVPASRQLLSPSPMSTYLLLENMCRGQITSEFFAKPKVSSMVAMTSFPTMNSASCFPGVLVTNLLTMCCLRMSLGTKVPTLQLYDQRRYIISYLILLPLWDIVDLSIVWSENDFVP